MSTPTAWAPFNSTLGASVPSRAALTALTIPQAIDGMSIFCTEVGFQKMYAFSLNSGATVNGTSVLATSIGSNSRWLAMGDGGGYGLITNLAPPLASAFTLVNFVGATILDSSGPKQPTLGLTSIVSPANNRHLAVVAAPAPKFKLTVGMIPGIYTLSGNTAVMGICVRDSATGQFVELIEYELAGARHMATDKFTNPTTPAGGSVDTSGGANVENYGTVFFRVEKRAADVVYSWSFTGMEDDFGVLDTITFAAFINPDQCGLLVDGNGAGAPAGNVRPRVVHWDLVVVP